MRAVNKNFMWGFYLGWAAAAFSSPCLLLPHTNLSCSSSTRRHVNGRTNPRKYTASLVSNWLKMTKNFFPFWKTIKFRIFCQIFHPCTTIQIVWVDFIVIIRNSTKNKFIRQGRMWYVDSPHFLNPPHLPKKRVMGRGFQSKKCFFLLTDKFCLQTKNTTDFHKQ